VTTKQVISLDCKTVGKFTKLRVTVSTVVLEALAGSTLKIEVTSFQSKPLYGHCVIGSPEVLSLKVKERGPHFDTPSAGEQLLLTVSGI